MALCSQVFNTSKRRSCDTSYPQQKKICLKNVSYKSVAYLSSEEDDDSEDEQSCYNADQIRAKRRASTRSSFLTNPVLSKAVSQYSDDNDDEESRVCERKSVSEEGNNASRKSSVGAAPQNIAAAAAAAAATYENLDCKLSSSPISLIPFTFNYFENNCVFNFSEGNHEDNSTAGSATSAIIINSNPVTPVPRVSKNVFATDKSARSRCFEYLVGSIDEAWARYCDAATNVEDEVYGYNTPASVATDDEYYFDNTTDITDYDDSDFDDKRPKQFMRPRLSSSASSTSLAAEDASSCQLQALKDRLTKAKYYLQDLVDSDNIHDVNSFWKRWDMIKYATIELVEDDDDDEVVETTIDELESGRYH